MSKEHGLEAPHANPIDSVEIASPLQYVSDPTQLTFYSLLNFDRAYFLQGTEITEVYMLDLLAPRITSATLIQKMRETKNASSSYKPDLRRVLDASTHDTPAAPDTRRLISEITDRDAENNHWLENTTHLNIYLRQISEQSGLPLDEVRAKFDDEALLRLVTQLEEQGFEVNLRLQRTPQELQEYLQNTQAALLTHDSGMRIAARAGVRFDQTTMRPWDQVEESSATLSINIPHGVFGRGLAKAIMRDYTRWQNDLQALGALLRNRVRTIFDGNQQLYMKEEGLQKLPPSMKQDLLDACIAQATYPLQDVLKEARVDFRTLLRFRPIVPYDPRITF